MPGGFPAGLELVSMLSVQQVALTLSASTNTKSGYTQLTASSPQDCVYLGVDVTFFSGNYASSAVDIAIGAGGSEIVIMSNLMCALNVAGGVTNARYLLPYNIPSGTRCAARAQTSDGTSGGDFVGVDLSFFDGAFTQIEGYAGVDTIGFIAGTTLGTALNPGATGVLATKGVYSQLTASTAVDYAGFMLGFDPQNADTGGPSWLVDIAVGAGGSEKIILYDMLVSIAGGINPPNMQFLPLPIPAGTRIAARCGSNKTTSNTLGLTFYGVYQ